MTEPTVRRHVDLTALNTLGLPARADALVEIGSDADVRWLLGHDTLGTRRKWVLGGGSNIVLAGDFDGCLLQVKVAGKRVLEETQEHVLLEAGAGECWHDFVAWTLQNGYFGLENLALIPGTVGAAPVQNIGAYGLEQGEFFHSLDLVDLVTGRSGTVPQQACHFGYRDSVFKRALAGKSLITRVRYQLPKAWKPRISYTDLHKYWQKRNQPAPNAREVFDSVCEIRRSKLPDPKVIGNVGSFFQNPVVNKTILDEILSEYPQIVSYPLADGTYKLAAAWMIEACGWRGKNLGAAGVFEQHALVLVNRGGATGRDMLALADAVIASVRKKFGVSLELEPSVVS